ncbi:Predicted Zn-dependent hydrolase (beta-lactamase superfamily) [Ceraceosorus bombacis]|uniref:Predicted Zn-dependent hydrolase (Beta-lactamase superfamily) n=1 Tax=Ceraceosorus bombacis TaxID=401625 RepID=A0A0P1B8V5_9BASI|nr:Predicted Zn-dependent hydrolase (beta-lactamase superfamily) [Ceraceosorus bombacis]
MPARPTSTKASGVVSTPLPISAPPFYASKPHHVQPSESGLPKSFVSPWKSAANHQMMDFLKARFLDWDEEPALPANLDIVKEVDWKATLAIGSDQTAVVWLGHACGLYLLPVPSTHAAPTKHIRVLTDPVFSLRCSPSQWLGPKRFTPAPTSIQAIKDNGAWPHVVALSHNHYDHLDDATLRSIVRLSDEQHPLPHFIAPLGLVPLLESLGIPQAHHTSLDWWQAVSLSLPLSADSSEVRGQLKATCTPAQHQSGRSTFDQKKTLWAGWALDSRNEQAGSGGANVWFAGDTGLRAVPRRNMSREEEDALPVCPAFEEVGELLGPFDLSMIPIGAYLPRIFMSSIHMAPHDAVFVHQKVKSRKSVGIHWGAWRLTPEDVLQPPRLLVEETDKVGLPRDSFFTTKIGETTTAQVQEP